MNLRQRRSFDPAAVRKHEDKREYLHLFVSSMSCQINKGTFRNQKDYKPSPYVCFVSTPQEAIKKELSRIQKFKSALREMCCLPWKRGQDGAVDQKKSSWPQTKCLRTTLSPNWDGDEVHFKIRTHDQDGIPIDLTGALMHIAVFDGKNGSNLIGTFPLNLSHFRFV